MATIDDNLRNIREINDKLALDIKSKKTELKEEFKRLEEELNALSELEKVVSVLKIKNINIGHRCIFTPGSLDAVIANLIEVKPKELYFTGGVKGIRYKAVIQIEVDADTLSVLV